MLCLQEQTQALHALAQGMVRQFAKSHAVWEAAVDAVAELDALMSLASVAGMFSVSGPMCRPKLVEACDDQQVSDCITRSNDRIYHCKQRHATG